MKKWTVSIPIYACATYEIEAETEQDAISKAFEEGLSPLCWSCANEYDISDYAYDGDAIAEEVA